MKNGKNKANTLAEVLMVLFVVGVVIAVVTLGSRKNSGIDPGIKFAYYEQLTAVRLVATEIRGTSETKDLPLRLRSMQGNVAVNLCGANPAAGCVKGFCELATEQYNVLGGVFCIRNIGVNPEGAIDDFSFETSSSVKFYNSTDAAADGNPYFFYLDVDGNKGRSRVAGINANRKNDIFRFVVYPQYSGGYSILPALDSNAADNAELLSATAVFKPNGSTRTIDTVPIDGATNVSYRRAVCVANRAPRTPVDYCGANAALGLLQIPADARCNVPNNPCEVNTHRPAPPLKF